MRTDTAPKIVRRSDYKAPDWLVDTVEMVFDLHETATKVTTTLSVRRNPDPRADRPDHIRLDGEGLNLLSLALDDRPVDLQSDALTLEETGLCLAVTSDSFRLKTETGINPQKNTALEGLYLSDGMFCTQCEAEGFRRITYFPDRPDVMAVYTVTVNAPADGFPVLLSNGNLQKSGILADGRHFATWHDPFPKPCYLFALVAGDLACCEDRFTTASGRGVTLRIYVEHGNEDRTAHAMDSLIRSMKWDEQVYGLEYDLDLFNIVAVSDFNMGAMENKSLNIFNAKLILAKPETATDGDYAFIESVVAHEYFHNWSGNRVTCRDWFQLSLKEGLTVFRDQEFSADQRSRPVQRIGDVAALRGRQFSEDAGPLAHPVRPDSYMEINNFYTATVYEKGAEVIRMLHKLLGAKGYRKGIDLYFARHDGQAVTCDDFIAAMAEATGQDLDAFKLWYAQAGTPHVSWSGAYEAAQNRYYLTVTQTTAPTPGQQTKQPLTLPVPVSLYATDGTRIASKLCVLNRGEQVFQFNDVTGAPHAVSLNEGFAAPIIMDTAQSPETSVFLMTHDRDPFNRWEAGFQFITGLMLEQIKNVQAGKAVNPDPRYLSALGTTLTGRDLDPAFKAKFFQLPWSGYLAERMAVIDVEAIDIVLRATHKAIGRALSDILTDLVAAYAMEDTFSADAAAAGRRLLRNEALVFLAHAGQPGILEQVQKQYDNAYCMTDRLAALMILVQQGKATAALSDFYNRFAGDAVVIDKWFGVQAYAPRQSVLDDVERLAAHPDFSLTNPNRFRSLVGAFTMNQRWFHDGSGRGYRFVGDMIYKLDEINPQTAANLAKAFGRWKRFDDIRAGQMQTVLEKLRAKSGVSKNLLEIITKSLDG